MGRMGSFSTEARSRVGGCLCEKGPHPELEIIENAEETMEDENNYPRTWLKNRKTKTTTTKKKKNEKVVFLEGYVEAGDEDKLGRTKSLTEEDLEELRGCLDLGFGFNYEEIPELCNTLPALELCYSTTQRFLDEHHHKPPESTPSEVEMCSSPPPPGPIANWKISSPGDHPEDVKARLKYWAQAVACTVGLCS